MVHAATGGADTAAWLRHQPCFTGRFATIGPSCLGFTQWALLQEPPPEMAAAVITAGPHDFSASAWGTGAFTLHDYLGWCHLVGHQEEGRRLQALIRQLGSAAPARPRCPRPCPSATRPGRCWARARGGTSPGWNIPTATTRSGARSGSMPRSIVSTFRCCSWADGNTCFSSRPSSSTGG